MLWNRTKWKPTAIHCVLMAFFAIGFTLRLYLAQFPNIIHPDATFQTLEPAHRLAYGYGVITWEWRVGIRNWVFPAFLAALMKATAWMGPGSSGYLWGIRAALSLLSLITIWFGFSWAKRASGTTAAILAAGICAIWYDLVIFAPAALTGIVAAHMLLPGLYLGQYAERIPERRRMFLAALFCGLAVSLRIQLAPAIAFALVYFCRSNWKKRAVPLAAGFLLPLLVFGLVDAFTWSYPFQSYVENFWVNAIQGKAAQYGIAPWYWYVLALLQQMGPLVALAVLGLRRSPFLGWITLIALASHSLIAHKELRFIYVVMPLIATLGAIGLVEIVRDLSARFGYGTFPPKFLLGSTLFVLSACSYGLSATFPYFQKNAAGIAAFDRLDEYKPVCGIDLYGLPWFATGGYAHLHTDIPILIVPTTQDLRLQAGTFDALVASRASIPPLRGFQLEACWNDGCLYRRRGACSPPARNYEINAVLRDTGQ